MDKARGDSGRGLGGRARARGRGGARPRRPGPPSGKQAPPLGPSAAGRDPGGPGRARREGRRCLSGRGAASLSGRGRGGPYHGVHSVCNPPTGPTVTVAPWTSPSSSRGPSAWTRASATRRGRRGAWDLPRDDLIKPQLDSCDVAGPRWTPSPSRRGAGERGGARGLYAGGGGPRGPIGAEPDPRGANPRAPPPRDPQRAPGVRAPRPRARPPARARPGGGAPNGPGTLVPRACLSFSFFFFEA